MPPFAMLNQHLTFINEFYLDLMIPPSADGMGVIKRDLNNAKVIINDTDCEFYCNTLCSIE